MSATKRSWTRTLLGSVLALTAAGALAADPPGPPKPSSANEGDAPATLRILNRDVVVLRARVVGLTPKLRVQRTLQRLRDLPPTAIDDPLRAVPTTFGDANGSTLVVGDRPLFSLVAGDLDPESGQNLDALVQQTLARLGQVRTTWHELHDRERLVSGALRTVTATLLLGS